MLGEEQKCIKKEIFAWEIDIDAISFLLLMLQRTDEKIGDKLNFLFLIDLREKKNAILHQYNRLKRWKIINKGNC